MYQGRDIYVGLANSCLALTDLEEGQSIAKTTVDVVENILPEMVAAVYLDNDVYCEHVDRFDGPLVIVPIEAGGYNFGRIELYGTRREFDEHARAALNLVAALTANAIKLRKLNASEHRRTALVYEVARLERMLEDRMNSIHQSFDEQELRANLLVHELQENISQNLAVVALGLKEIQDHGGEDAKMVEALHTTVLDTVNGVRDLVVDLGPPALEQFGLLSALRGLSEAHPEEIKLIVPQALPAISPQVSAACYRVIAELVRTRRPGSIATIELLDSEDTLAIAIATVLDKPPASAKWELMRSEIRRVDGTLTLSRQDNDRILFKISAPFEGSPRQ